MRYIGIDLAWGQTARTGLAELDGDGRLVRSTSARSDDDIAAFIGVHGAGVVAAIDAPLVVPNETGQRPCERDVARLFGKYQASAYPANRGNAAFTPEPRGARLSRQFAWDLDPSVRPHPDRAVAIEVYPHPAMVSLFGLDRVIPYKGKKGRDVPARQRAFADLFDAIEVACGSLLQLASSTRWQELRQYVAGTPRQVDLDRVEDEVDAIFCAYLAWLWANAPSTMTVLGDVATGYIVTPPPPIVGQGERVFHVDPDAGEIRFGDGVVAASPPVGSDLASSYRPGGGSSGNVAAASTPSAVSRLFDEISWEGNAKKYRGGGAHLENVVTTEVFAALDFLPRARFLAGALLDGHGADAARTRAAARSEEALVDVLPGDLSPTWLSGEDTGWRIQPDVLVTSPDSLIYVEAKALHGGKFSARQVARSLQATLHAAGDRTALLLLVLDTPPPLRVKGHGPLSVRDALEAGLTGFPSHDADQLREALDDTVAWTTWEDIADSVRTSLAAFTNADPSLRGTVSRLASTAVNAIRIPS